MRRSTLLTLAALSASLPGTALACPVCFSANDQNRLAFLGTTIFLTLLPLAMIGGVALWIRARLREAAAAPAADVATLAAEAED